MCLCSQKQNRCFIYINYITWKSFTSQKICWTCHIINVINHNMVWKQHFRSLTNQMSFFTWCVHTPKVSLVSRCYEFESRSSDWTFSMLWLTAPSRNSTHETSASRQTWLVLMGDQKRRHRVYRVKQTVWNKRIRLLYKAILLIRLHLVISKLNYF